MIKAIIDAVSIPVMAKARIGHVVEAQILQAVGVDYIDGECLFFVHEGVITLSLMFGSRIAESEVLTMADDKHHIPKHPFKVPFVCGAKDLGEALRRISEGASMVRSKGEAGSGNVVECVFRKAMVVLRVSLVV